MAIPPCYCPLMMMALRIFGFLLTALSASVLMIAFKKMLQAHQYLRKVHSISDPISLGQERLIIWAWIAALVVGVALVVLSFAYR